MSEQAHMNWQRRLYDHGGSRIFTVGEDGFSETLMADTYDLRVSNLMFAAPQLLAACKRAKEHLDDAAPSALNILVHGELVDAIRAAEEGPANE